MDSCPPIRILIIDDNRVDRELYKQCLQVSPAPGFEFAESDTAVDGINRSRAWQADCALLDVNLPDMDGIEVLSALKGESDLLPFAVVMLTAYGDEDVAVRAMKAGAMDYLPKRHLDSDTLRRTVVNAIERFRMQKQAGRAVLQEQKLEGIGRLAGGVAHDFNNLLTGIVLGTSCAMDSLPATHPAQEMLQTVVHASERAAELTRRMLACAGKGNSYLEITDMNHVMRDVCEAIRASIPNTILLECHSGGDVPLVKTDLAQMRQAIVDLVMNAVEAIGEGVSGTVWLRTALVEIDEESVRQSDLQPGAMCAGKYAALEVQDTGCGMDEETQSRIFDPFFTTKFVGRGLGLAAVHGFVRSNGGGVQVYSAPGQGTRLRILLPAAAEIQVPGRERLAAAI
jgi:signal transduction histidine kinase